MKKLKNLWMNNRILLILGIVLLVCIVAIVIVTSTYFIGSKKSDGGRFDNMKTHIKEKEQDEYIKALEERSGVDKVAFRVNNKTLMIRVTFKDDIKLDDAKKIIEESIDKFSDAVKETYDMNFTISGKIFGTLMAARNVSGNGFSWSNNTQVESKN